MTRSETEAVVEQPVRPVMTPALNAEVRHAPLTHGQYQSSHALADSAVGGCHVDGFGDCGRS